MVEKERKTDRQRKSEMERGKAETERDKQRE